MNEQAVLVIGPGFGILSTVCEMLDSPEGTENKIFRFKTGCKWRVDPNPIRRIHVFSYWPFPDEGQEIGECLGRYRVTRKLETPPGYVAAFEGTTRPEVSVAVPTVEDPDTARCESAIMSALEAESPMPVRILKRRTHPERFRDGLWDECLQGLADAGEIQLEDRRGLTDTPRQWASVTTPPPTLSPENDSVCGTDN